MKRMIIAVLLLLQVPFYLTCQDSVMIPDRLDNSLLYVESKDKEGIGAGEFCEIVSFDMNTREAHHLTNDNYYDRYPAYSPTLNLLIFESKRSASPEIVGLTANSGIYEIDFSSKKVRRLKLQIDTKESVEIQKFKPTFSRSGKSMSFLQQAAPARENLYIKNMINDSVFVVQENIIFPQRLIWADDTRIYYSANNSVSIKNYDVSIYLIDLDTKLNRIIIEGKNSENIVGDILQNIMVYIFRESSYASEHFLKVLDLSTMEEEYSINMSEMGFKEIKTPVFESAETIYFIGNPKEFEGATGDDIYKLELQTMKIERITNNELMKDDLIFVK